MANNKDAVRFNFKGNREEESADAKWMKRIEAIKEDIHRYWMDCDFAVDDKECKQCGKNVFLSILRIIDKHTKEGAEE